MLVKPKKSIYPQHRQQLKKNKPRSKVFNDKFTNVNILSKTMTSNQTKSIDQIKNCQSCLQAQAQLICYNCSQKSYCLQCFQKIHSQGKFINHWKKFFTNVSQISQNNVVYKQQENLKEIQKRIYETNEIQKWDQLTIKLKQNLQQIIQNIINKKEEILDKLQLQKQKQLNILKKKYYSKIKMNDKNIEDKSFSLSNLRVNPYTKSPQKKVKENYSFPYKLNNQTIQQIQKLIQKIQWKSIILNKQIQSKKQHKKTQSMNSSIFFNSQTKKHNYKCNISKSIIDLKYNDKIRSDKAILQDFIKQKKRKIMSKARSQRAIKNFVQEINMNIVIE